MESFKSVGETERWIKEETVMVPCIKKISGFYRDQKREIRLLEQIQSSGKSPTHDFL